MPFATAHLQIFHCTHHPVIPQSDLYFTFCSTFKVPMKRNFFSYERALKNWKTAVYRFSISYLVVELESFEDAKIKGKVQTRNMRFL